MIERNKAAAETHLCAALWGHGMVVMHDPREKIVDAERGEVSCRHRKVAIVGAGPGRNRAPFGDDTWCVWGINEIYQPRLDRHFELHPMSVQSIQDFDGIASCPVPQYVLDLPDAQHEHIRTLPNVLTSEGLVPAGVSVFTGAPRAVRFPLDRITALGYGDYFTCTFAYQLALAILEGFEEIALYGITLYHGTARERLLEAPCVEYWLGVAQGRGILVRETSGLASHPRRYGYDYHQEMELAFNVVDSLCAVRRDELMRKAEREGRVN